LIRRLEEFQAREFARMRLEEAENEELDETIDRYSCLSEGMI
jgi:hypothetical protein